MPITGGGFTEINSLAQMECAGSTFGGRNARYRSADIPVRLELPSAVEADKNVRAPVGFLHSRRKP